jgi:PPOX class probable F420-dependent enzyme
MSGRAAIALTPEEVVALLEAERTLICASIGRDGWPHLMPLWYTVRDGEPWAWTYAKSQKVRNLERDPRCTVQVEAGTSYRELRGLMAKAEATIHREPDVVAAFGAELGERYGEPPPDVVARQAPKRVALRFALRELATWDHRKLA